MPDNPTPTVIPFTPDQQQQWNQMPQTARPAPAVPPSSSTPPGTIPYSADQLRQKMAADPWFPLSLDQSRTLYNDAQQQSLGEKVGKLWSGAKRGAAGILDTFKEAHDEMKDTPFDLPTGGRTGATLAEGIARGAMFWKNMGAETYRYLRDKVQETGDPEEAVQLYHQRMLAAQADERAARGLPDERPASYDPSKPSYIFPKVFGYEPFDKAANAVSLFLPPAPPVAAGMKGVVAPVAKALGQESMQALIKGAARVPGALDALEEMADRGAQYHFDFGMRKAAQTAAGGVESAGRAVKNLAKVPGQKLTEAAERFVPEEARATVEGLSHLAGPGAALAGATGHGGPFGAVAAGLKAAQLGGSALEQTGAFLRHLTATYGDSAKSRLLQVATNPEAPEWIRKLAGGLDDLGVGTAVKTVKDLGESATHGAATGAGMGLMTGKDPEQIGEYMGGGALLGAAGRGVSKAIGADAKMEAARRALASKQRLWDYLERTGVPVETRSKIDDFTATVAGTALDLFGKDPDIRFMDPEQAKTLAAQQGQAGASAWTAQDPTTGRKTIYITAGDKTGRLLHELPHAVARAAGADDHARLMIDSIFSPEQLQVMRREYAQKMVDGELRRTGASVIDPGRYQQLVDGKVAQLDQQHGGNQWIYDEIYAEAGFSGLLDRSLERIANGDPVWDRLKNKARGTFWSAMGMDVDPQTGEPLVGPNPSASLFSNPDVYNNPQLRRMFYENVRKWNRYGAQEASVSKETREGVPEGTRVNMDLYGKHPAVPMTPNPATGRLENDAAVKNPRTGEVTLRKPAEVRRIERERQENTRKAYERQPVKPVTDSTPDVSPRQNNEGKVETVGTKVTGQLQRMPWISEEARKNAKVYEDQMGTGDVVDAWYQAIGHGWKWYQDVKRRLGNIAAAKLKLAPFLFKVSKEGNLLVVGLSLTAAQRKMAKWASTGKLNAEWGGDVGLFQKDLLTYLKNHADAVDGGTGLNPNKKNLLNAFVLGDNRAFSHLNPLRDTLKGEDKQGIIRSLRLDRIASAEPAPDKGWFPRYEKLKYNQSPDVASPPDPEDDIDTIPLVQRTAEGVSSEEAPEVPRTPMGDGKTPRSTAAYFLGRAAESIQGTGAEGGVTLSDILEHLTRPNAQAGRLLEHTPENKSILARALADEALYAITQDKNAIGWYDAKVKEAWKHLEALHPEFRTDDNARMVFRAILAITSNGSDVKTGMFRTDDIYREYKQTGKINTKGGASGKSSAAINAGLQTLSDLIREQGLDKTREFLEAEFTVGELKKLGIDVAGESVGTKVRGAMVLGPKIGSFYGNLRGDFSTVTMDRWFMRTFNRIGGTLMDPLIGPMQKQVSRILAALNKTKAEHLDGYKTADLKENLRDIRRLLAEGKVNVDNAKAVFGEVGAWCLKHEKEFAKSGFKKRSELNMGNHTLWTSLFEANEAPTTGTERNWIREVVGETQNLLRAAGIDMSNADLQAVLWYYEKKLYAKFGYKAPRGAPTDYAEAAHDLFQARNGQ